MHGTFLEMHALLICDRSQLVMGSNSIPWPISGARPVWSTAWSTTWATARTTVWSAPSRPAWSVSVWPTTSVPVRATSTGPIWSATRAGWALNSSFYTADPLSMTQTQTPMSSSVSVSTGLLWRPGNEIEIVHETQETKNFIRLSCFNFQYHGCTPLVHLWSFWG